MHKQRTDRGGYCTHHDTKKSDVQILETTRSVLISLRTFLVWRLREEPRADAPRGSSFFKRPREPEPLGLEIDHRLLARGRVTAIKCIARAVAYEDRPEPGFARRRLLRAHDVTNAVFAVEYCETVAIIYLRCTYESQHPKHAKGVFWPIGDAPWPARMGDRSTYGRCRLMTQSGHRSGYVRF
jgi:hypothetical protein